ncbi:MAG TPA: hemolysin III family protein [Tepidisphaeraceae bacterium]|jgi:hemolysin III
MGLSSPDDESRGEELASLLTHAVGALLGVAAMITLVVLATMRGDPWRIVSFSIYGASLVTLYAMSSCYHWCRPGKSKQLFRFLDHSAIFILIAGTYTPFALVTLRGHWGWSLFAVIWGLALLGIFFKTMFTGRFTVLSTILYVAMGWVCLAVAHPLLMHLPFGGIVWLLAGGVAYTGGVIFFVWDNLPFNHAVWHLFVLAGSACHFFAVVYAVLP